MIKGNKSTTTMVKTSLEVDVKEIVTRELEKVVQEKIDELSSKYFRTISVEINTNIE